MRTVLLFLMCLGLGGYWFLRPTNVPAAPAAVATLSAAPRAPLLALRDAAKADEVLLAIQDPGGLNFLSRQEVFDLRRMAVNREPLLLAAAYEPSAPVFGQIADGAPWWGLEGQFRNGPGKTAIAGMAEESRFLFNPFLLVAPEFNDWWPGSEYAAAGAPELACLPLSLTWKPRAATATARYSEGCIARRQRTEFDLIAYNARDLGFDYIHVDYRASHNIGKIAQPLEAYRNPQFLHKGGSCGFPGGCNNMSPRTPPIDGLQLHGLPATVVVKLWRTAPESVDSEPDFRFVIEMR